MAYQVAKEIGSAAAVLHGQVDAYYYGWSRIRQRICEGYIQNDWIADVVVYAGEDELQALAEGALRV